MPAITQSDGSSAISEARKYYVASRDGALCVLCGDTPVDVAHIVARKSGDPAHVNWIRGISPLLQGFRKDDAANLICLCPSHHRKYDKGLFVLVPTEGNRKQLHDHEVADFAMREQSIEHGRLDPGRSFPSLALEIDYIPIYPDHFFMVLHHSTPYDPGYFVFDTLGNHPCPPLHFQASFVALMLEAQPCLASITRIQSPKNDMAEREVAELLKLYNRIPRGQVRPKTISASNNAILLLNSMLQNSPTYPNAHVLSSIPGSPPLLPPTPFNTIPFTADFQVPNSPTLIPGSPTFTNTSLQSNDINTDEDILSAIPGSPSLSASTPHNTSFTADSHVLNAPGLTPSSSTSTNAVSDASEPDDAYANVDHQLLEYSKEPAMSWEDLKNRTPLVPGEQAGALRFATAEDICRRWQ